MTWWFALLAAPFAGSLLFVFVRRLPAGRSALLSRSRCESCGHKLGPLELVPIASFLAQRGRCRACGAPIDVAHLAAELIALLLAAAVAATGAEGLALWGGCGLGWTLLALAWIDWEEGVLPDALTLPLLVSGLLLSWWLVPWTLADRAIGAIAGYIGFRALATLYRALRKREGLGQGDAKLLAASGAWLGWQALGKCGAAGGAACAGLRPCRASPGSIARRDHRIAFRPGASRCNLRPLARADGRGTVPAARIWPAHDRLLRIRREITASRRLLVWRYSITPVAVKLIARDVDRLHLPVADLDAPRVEIGVDLAADPQTLLSRRGAN